MKHKRQSLNKNGEEDDKEGGGRTKSDKAQLQEEKRSCQGCDLPPDVALNLESPRTAAANNNNSSSFNNNSNASSGSSSVASSLGSSFDKEDSRSHDGKGDITVKVESGLTSPPCLPTRTPQQAASALAGATPKQEPTPPSQPPPDIAVVKPPRGSGSSSLATTPLGLQQQASPQSAALYHHPAQARSRSSPITGTAAASAAGVGAPISSATAATAAPAPAASARCPGTPMFQQGVTPRGLVFSNRPSTKDQAASYRDMYQQRFGSYESAGSYGRHPAQQGQLQPAAASRINGSLPRPHQVPKNTHYEQPSPNQYQQYNSYNGYSEHPAYHSGYNRLGAATNGHPPYNQQCFPGEHEPGYQAGFQQGYNSQYNAESQLHPHMQQQQQHEHMAYYNADAAAMQQCGYVEYPNNKQHTAYYEQQQHMHLHNGDVHPHQQHQTQQAQQYASPAGEYPMNQSATVSGPAAPAATACILTPPSSSSEHCSPYQFFGDQQQVEHHPQHTAENSNSSTDFNFLSNLNDFSPEYYQLS